jgi:hypothetical protein
VKQGVHLHDGFFLRMALGGGSVKVNIEPQQANPGDAEIKGGAATFEIALGGTPVDGLVIGGRLVGTSGPEPDVAFRGITTAPSDNVELSMTQLFVDVYPMPKEGLHLLGAFGAATLAYETSGKAAVYVGQTGGYAVTVGAGWEGWIGEQWSLGGMLQLTWMRFDADVAFYADTSSGTMGTLYDENATITAFSPTLSVTATLH